MATAESNVRGVDAAVPEKVYVVGAGFSAGLGFPLTNELLELALARMSKTDRSQILKILEFHFPSFQFNKPTTYPNIEDLLTRIKINVDLFHATRDQVGRLRIEDLQGAEQRLLYTLALFFHQIKNEMGEPQWLHDFVEHVIVVKAAIISFNWDLVLDVRLGREMPSKHLYGAGIRIRRAVRLLKPHGSLNWYQDAHAKFIKEENLESLWKPENSDEKDSHPSVWLFKHARPPISSMLRQYVPWIVPPTFVKSFDHPLFEKIFRTAVDRLSTATEVVFLGYSMPTYDFHSEFLFRCAFNNQRKGKIVGPTERSRPTGPSKVVVVNPDSKAAERIHKVLGVECEHYQTSVSTWVLGRQFAP